MANLHSNKRVQAEPLSVRSSGHRLKGARVAHLEEVSVAIGDLLLDPNNYRFQDYEDFVLAEESRFYEPSVQATAYARLRNEGLAQLKDSILTNGFLLFERIVAMPYDSVEGKYLVVEGNRRVAALRWIASDHEAGVAVPKEVLDTVAGVLVIALQDGEDDPVIRLSLMGVRHIGGIREWVFPTRQARHRTSRRSWAGHGRDCQSNRDDGPRGEPALQGVQSA